MNINYLPLKLYEEKDKICKEKDTDLSFEEANLILNSIKDDDLIYKEKVNDIELAGIILWVSEHYSIENEIKILKLWNVWRSFGALKLLFTKWQDRYDSLKLNEICKKILKTEQLGINCFDEEGKLFDKQKFETKYESVLWICFWKRLLKAHSIEDTASKKAALYCHENKKSLTEWMKLFKIRPKSRLGSKIQTLLYCYCWKDEFDCSDDTLLRSVLNMNEDHCELLLRNMILCFPLDKRNDHIYMKDYYNSLNMIFKNFQDNWCVKLISEYLSERG